MRSDDLQPQPDQPGDDQVRRRPLHPASRSPQAVDRAKPSGPAQHGFVQPAASGLEGGVHQAVGLRKLEQGGSVLRQNLLGPEQQPLRSRRINHSQQVRD